MAGSKEGEERLCKFDGCLPDSISSVLGFDKGFELYKILVLGVLKCGLQLCGASVLLRVLAVILLVTLTLREFIGPCLKDLQMRTHGCGG